MTELDRWRHRLRLDGHPYGSDDWMFCNRSGRCLNPELLSQLFDRIVQRSGVPRIRFHDLRHTHASLLVANGVPIKVVPNASVTLTLASRCTPTNVSCPA